MKLPLPPKTLLLFVGSFVLINVAMYFLLKATQPKSAIPGLAEKSAVSDSAAHKSEPTLSAAEAKRDSAKAPETMPSAAESVAATSKEPRESTEPSPMISESQEISSEFEQVPEEGEEVAAESEASDEMDSDDDALEEEDSDIQAEDLTTAVMRGDPKQIQRLAKLLESMKPQQAALIMTRLADETIVALFMRMKERPAAKILALLPVDQAARVSNLMIHMVSSR
ncbi:MAG: hypothetical protein FJY66_02135 [Calditrichaeota bacterium]|nr:hypothetical protein [Calditrichota bacterium]